MSENVVYTYFDEEGQAEVSETEPHAGVGKVWALGEYAGAVNPSPLSVRAGRGNSVWLIIDFLRGRSINDVVAYYQPALTRKDVEAAMAYYMRYKEDIDAKLSEHNSVA